MKRQLRTHRDACVCQTTTELSSRRLACSADLRSCELSNLIVDQESLSCASSGHHQERHSMCFRLGTAEQQLIPTRRFEWLIRILLVCDPRLKHLYHKKILTPESKLRTFYLEAVFENRTLFLTLNSRFEHSPSSSPDLLEFLNQEITDNPLAVSLFFSPPGGADVK